MMSTKIDPAVFGKALETVNVAGKIVANLTDPKKPQPVQNPPQVKKDSTNTNQPHTQTVEVKVGNPDQPDIPRVIHEKKETHVHKTYPDGRAMSKEECEVEKLRIQTAHENANEERAYQMELEKMRREERREREEYERKQRERRDAERKKSDKRFWTWAAVGGAVIVAGICYSMYTDYRNARAAQPALPEPQLNVSIVKEPHRAPKVAIQKQKPVLPPPPKPVNTPKVKAPKPIKVEGTVK